MGKLIIPFEETLKRHQTKPNCNDFGEEAMRRWWREKDFSDVSPTYLYSIPLFAFIHILLNFRIFSSALFKFFFIIRLNLDLF